MIRAALFDLDGTLCDSEPLIAAALVETLAAHGYEVTAPQVIDALGPPFEGIVRALIPDLDDAGVEVLWRDYVPTYTRQLPRLKPLPGADALLDALEARGVQIAVVTNKAEYTAEEQIAALGWAGRFPLVVGAETAGLAKPDPAPARYALERFGVPPSEAAFIGDTGTDMRCARAAGIEAAIGLALERTPDELREAGATEVCADLAAVAVVLGLDPLPSDSDHPLSIASDGEGAGG